MLYPALIMLLAAAAFSFGLSRAVPTRLIGFSTVVVALGAAMVAAVATAGSEPVELLQLYRATFSITPGLAVNERLLAATLLAVGGVTLVALTWAIAPVVRGFGALFAWALLALAAGLLSLGAPPRSLIQPLAWAVLAMAAYGALRQSGAADDGENPSPSLVAGLVASLLLTAALLMGGAVGTLPSTPVALAGLLAVLLFVAAPPFVSVRAEVASAPAALGVLLYGLTMPTVALSWLLRTVALLPPLPNSWSVVLGVIGGFGLLATAAGALGEQRLRMVLSWVAAGQGALVVATLGLRDPLAGLAGPGLLLALMLGLVVATGAVALFERMAGSDNYHEGTSAAHPVVGLLWAIGIAALFGLPPFWSFWPHLWLFQAFAATQPWMLVPVATGLALTFLALLAPLGRFWMGGSVEEVRLSWLELAPLMLVVLVMLVLGLAPWLVWDGWFRSLPMAPVAMPVDTTTQLVATLTGLALVGVTVGLIRARSTRLAILDPDEQPVALAPDALGGLLQPLARLADSALLLRGLGVALLYVSRTLRLLIGLFEHNYYLMGVLAALIVLMLLMAQ